MLASLLKPASRAPGHGGNACGSSLHLSVVPLVAASRSGPKRLSTQGSTCSSSTCMYGVLRTIRSRRQLCQTRYMCLQPPSPPSPDSNRPTGVLASLFGLHTHLTLFSRTVIFKWAAPERPLCPDKVFAHHGLLEICCRIRHREGACLSLYLWRHCRS